MKSPSKLQIRESVLSTTVMDWHSWGPTLPVAVEEFSTAIRLGWPDLAGDIDRIVREMGGSPDSFGLLQDLAEAGPS